MTAPDAPPKPRRDLSNALPWVAVLAITAGLAVGNASAFDLDRAGGNSFWVWAIAPTFVVAVVALVRAARDGELWDMIRLEWGDATRGILSAAVLFGAAVGVLHLVAPSGSPRDSWVARIYLQLGNPSYLRAHVGVVALVVLVAAAGEEIVWRGLVTRLIAEQVGSRVAWAWAAVPYALSLAPTVWALKDPEAGLNPLLVLAGLGLGLVWGGMARATRRLAPSILSHAAFDCAVILFFRLWGSGV
jgi:membrane protease YdiL (CAAX protease family)